MPSESLEVQAHGWIRAIPTPLDMAIALLARRIGVTQPRVSEIETASRTGAITLTSLKWGRPRVGLPTGICTSAYKTTRGNGRAMCARLCREAPDSSAVHHFTRRSKRTPEEERHQVEDLVSDLIRASTPCLRDE